MVATPKELYQRAMSLSEQDRAELVGLLLESLDMGNDLGAEAEWLREIERRVSELDAGTVEALPWAEVRARVFEPSAR